MEKPKYIPLAKNNDENANVKNTQFSVIESVTIQSHSDIISKSERFSDSAFSTFVHIVSILVENGQKENLLKFIEEKLDLPKFPNLCDSVLSAIVNLLEKGEKYIKWEKLSAEIDRKYLSLARLYLGHIRLDFR